MHGTAVALPSVLTVFASWWSSCSKQLVVQLRDCVEHELLDVEGSSPAEQSKPRLPSLLCRACREDFSCDGRTFCDRKTYTLLKDCREPSLQQRDGLNAVNPCPM